MAELGRGIDVRLLGRRGRLFFSSKMLTADVRLPLMQPGFVFQADRESCQQANPGKNDGGLEKGFLRDLDP